MNSISEQFSSLPKWARYGIIAAAGLAVLYVVWTMFRGRGNGGGGSSLPGGSPSVGGGAEPAVGAVGNSQPLDVTGIEAGIGAVNQGLSGISDDLASLRDQFNSITKGSGIVGDKGTTTATGSVPATGGATTVFHADTASASVTSGVRSSGASPVPVSVAQATTPTLTHAAFSEYEPGATATPNYNPAQNRNVAPTRFLSGADTQETTPHVSPIAAAAVLGVLAVESITHNTKANPNKAEAKGTTKPGPKLGAVAGKFIV